jgi:tRNA A-37 threonylcarbamoyl transferase component Bud32
VSSSSTLAGRYRLGERIATGGIGEVWRAQDVLLERPVAVKLLRREHAADPMAQARFRAEAKHAGALSHDGIAQIYDYGPADPPHPPYLVMELVDGQSLADLLAGGPLAPAHALDVIAQTAAGLGAAHLAGLVHCDIKPGNLLLTRDGKVKIADFGIAQVAGGCPDLGPRILLGTPAYLAPELLAGAPATPASDMYALGIVAYECLTGSPPFAGTRLEIARAHAEQPVPPLPGSVPAEAAAFVAELVEKREGSRPGDASEVSRRARDLRDRLSGLRTAPQHTWLHPALAATLTDLPLPFTAAPARRPGSRWSGRSVLVAGLATVTATVVGVVLAIALTSASPAPQGSPPARAGAGHSVAALTTVAVNTAQLAGQPVGAVRRHLQQLGLSVRVLWVSTDLQPTGTVLSVQPSGQVPIGSVVTVIAALQPRTGSPSTAHDQGGGGDGHGGSDGGGSGSGH